MTRASERSVLGREIAWFAVVGLIGFAVDATLFLVLNGAYGWSIAGARTLSASCSIVTTWSLNRRLTFSHRKSPGRAGELFRYTLVQLFGLLVNIGVFALTLWLIPPLRDVPIVALGFGAAAAFVFNFLSARVLAFRGSEALHSS
jgi:putative flippase GtrA